MNEKTGWFGSVLRGRTAGPMQTNLKHCPQGHAMSLDWGDRCPYCEAQKTAAEPTPAESVFKDFASGGKGAPGPTRMRDETEIPRDPPEAAGRRATRVIGDASDAQALQGAGGSSPPPAGRRTTRVLDVDDPGKPAPAPPDGGRALRGVVFTFRWSRLGQLFPVREGRNYAGSGDVGPDGRPLDVGLREDREISSTHFLILCQGAKYRIRDVDSTNGTFVDDVQIDSVGIDLEDGAVIRAGTTLFGFQAIRAPAAGAGARMEPPPDDVDERDAPVPRPTPPPRSGPKSI